MWLLPRLYDYTMKQIPITLFSVLLLSACANSNAEVKLNKFPVEEFSSIVAYQMNGEGEEAIFENGALSKMATGRQVELNAEQTMQLLEFIQDKKAFGGIASKCFSPRHAFVFYNEKRPVAHLTICLECGWVKSTPDLGGFAFSRKGEKQLNNLMNSIF